MKKTNTKLLVVAIVGASFAFPTPARAGWTGALLGAVSGYKLGGGWGAVAGGFAGNWLQNAARPSQSTVVYQGSYGGGGGGGAAANVNYVNIDYKKLEGAIRGGFRDGYVDGMRIIMQEQAQAAVLAQMEKNRRYQSSLQPKFETALRREVETNPTQWVCATFCGGMDGDGNLHADVVVSHGDGNSAAYANLTGGCAESLLYRSVRDQKTAGGAIFQALVPAKNYSVCKPPLTAAANAFVKANDEGSNEEGPNSELRSKSLK